MVYIEPSSGFQNHLDTNHFFMPKHVFLFQCVFIKIQMILQEGNRELPTTPLLLLDQVEKPTQYRVSLDQQYLTSIKTGTTDEMFIEGITALLAAYFTFNIEYPKIISHT